MQENVLMMDDPKRPESVDVYMKQSVFHPSVTVLQHCFRVYYLPTGNTSVYFLQVFHGYVCFMESVSSSYSRIQAVASLFECPKILKSVRKRDWFPRWSHHLSITTHSMILLIIGLQVALICILFTVIKVLQTRYKFVKEFYKRNARMTESLSLWILNWILNCLLGVFFLGISCNLNFFYLNSLESIHHQHDQNLPLRFCHSVIIVCFDAATVVCLTLMSVDSLGVFHGKEKV